MIAEGSLHNPALFTGKTPIAWEIALEYLEFAEKYPPCPLSYVRGHVFKICHHGLQRHTGARSKLSDAKSLNEMKEAVIDLRNACKSTCWLQEVVDSTLPLSHWLCQPYVRPPPSSKTLQTSNDGKTEVENSIGTISKKKMKKLLKRGHDISDLYALEPSEKATKIANLLYKPPKPEYMKCAQCGNPGGIKCIFKRCKPCCKTRMKESKLRCSYHSNFKRGERKSSPNFQNGKSLTNIGM